MVSVSGVRVLVTGGSSGLGKAMAEALVGDGAIVALTSRDARRADLVAKVMTARAPGRAVGIALDVRSERSVDAAVASAAALLGRIDVLVNNAGIGMRAVNPEFLTSPQPFWRVDPDGFRDVVATNLTGYFLVARAAVPRMVRAGGGKVVNVTMNHATMRRAGFTPYGPARAGAEALSRIMAADLADTPVTVNLLLPGGATATGMIPDGVAPGVRETLLDPAVMGPPIRWLCSPESDGVRDERIVATTFDEWLAARAAASRREREDS
jgi:NAD(P)-dependent dehydrogenase (short-subunit alcohol dehydrogenase family)